MNMFDVPVWILFGCAFVLLGALSYYLPRALPISPISDERMYTRHKRSDWKTRHCFALMFGILATFLMSFYQTLLLAAYVRSLLDGDARKLLHAINIERYCASPPTNCPPAYRRGNS